MPWPRADTPLDVGLGYLVDLTINKNYNFSGRLHPSFVLRLKAEVTTQPTGFFDVIKQHVGRRYPGQPVVQLTPAILASIPAAGITAEDFLCGYYLPPKNGTSGTHTLVTIGDDGEVKVRRETIE